MPRLVAVVGWLWEESTLRSKAKIGDADIACHTLILCMRECMCVCVPVRGDVVEVRCGGMSQVSAGRHCCPGASDIGC